MESESAFSIYTTKRKNIEHLISEKSNKRNSQIAYQRKRKQKYRRNIKTKHIESANQQKQHKETIKSIRKSNNDSDTVQLIHKIHNISNVHRRLRLKKKWKNKNKKKSDKGEAVQMIDGISMDNIKTESYENELDNINYTSHSSNESNEINKNYSVDSNPIENSRQVFQWLLQPVDTETFFEQNWEKTPMYVKRDLPNYYKHLVSTPLLDQVLRKYHVQFTKNIDITSYTDGVRETHNPPGRAVPSIVWDYYQNKCSVRMLNPQTFIPAIHALNATLQEMFGCFVGANLYLTPPDSQGFAPHYDDVEAFILQIEGQKRWRLYRPLTENEYLPRYSSNNFDQSEIGQPILDTIVKAGDLLYLPRGTIHQGMTLDGIHSLHVTLSVYQKNSWVDLLEKVLPQALKQASKNDSRFREGLPLNYLTYVGSVYDESSRKDSFKNSIKQLITLLTEHIDVDNAADLMAKNHIHDFLPPFIFENERKCTVADDGEIMTKNGLVVKHSEITLETRIRLLRSHCIRLIKEDTYRVYYSTENSKEYHEYEAQFLEVGEEYVPGIKQIIISYPDFISVKELPIETDGEKILVVKDLWEKGLILTEDPLCSVN